MTSSLLEDEKKLEIKLGYNFETASVAQRPLELRYVIFGHIRKSQTTNTNRVI
jgi:hypothetical protein